MADEPEDDELLLDQAEPEGEDEEQEQTEAQAEPEGESEGFEVFFGDEPAPGSGDESGLAKHLREEIRKRDKELADLRKKVGSGKIEVGDKPTLAGCDFDEERYDAERDQWEERRRAAQAQESQTDQAERARKEEWQRAVQSYEAKKANLTFADMNEVETIVTGSLNEIQQAAIIMSADNPALVFTGLAKHPAKLAELSQITNPLKLAAAVARLEGGLKVMPRRKVAEPEEVLSGVPPASLKEPTSSSRSWRRKRTRPAIEPS
jgi:hypothetical protein